MMESPRLGIPSRIKLHNNTVDWVLVMFWSKTDQATSSNLQTRVTTAFPVATVKDVIDTTAAGDSFNGVDLTALLDGLSPNNAIATAPRYAGQVIVHKGALVPHSELRRAKLGGVTHSTAPLLNQVVSNPQPNSPGTLLLK